LPAVNYLNNGNCIYLIESSLSRLKLRFTRFSLENNYDFLTIYSADSFDDIEGMQSNAAAAAELRSQADAAGQGRCCEQALDRR
jgi:hypothetical protein